jgi:hypothetical protein
MRTPLAMLLLVFAFPGCRSNSPEIKPTASSSGVAAPQQPGAINTPAPARGRVASVNASARFVVLRFPIGGTPALQKRLGVYRQGAKVGELRVSGPQYDNNTVADIIAGECRIGDEAREE